MRKQEEGLTTKACTKCELVKPVAEFGIRNYANYSTYRSDCKKCNQGYSKKYHKENPEKVLETNRKYLSTRKDIAKQWNRNYFLKNGDRVRERARINQAIYRSDPATKILYNNRIRIYHLMKTHSVKKAATTVNLIGCTSTFLKNWLEWQFDSNMNWKNYGTYWEMDHVTPCDSYDMLNEEEQFECFNWRNLRSCEVSKNRSKNDKIIYHDILMQEIKVNYYSNEVLDTTL